MISQLSDFRELAFLFHYGHINIKNGIKKNEIYVRMKAYLNNKEKRVTMEQDDRKVNFGFDAGISSAGWSVVDANNGEIIEAGVRLFSGADAARNAERRSFRQSRRLIRRRTVRLHDACELLKKTFHVEDIIDDSTINPYEARVKGLTEKLSKQELFQALLHIIKRRGISYDLGDLEDEDGTKGNDFKASIDRNRRELKTKTPGEIQLERLKENGAVRGQVVVNSEDGDSSFILRNTFPMVAYADEALRILNQQKQYYPEITDDFIDHILELIQRKRKYFEGPGSEKSRTDYGIYRTNGETLDNLFEILIGKDKFYPNEYRAAASSYTAQLFNLLNDLNNLRITSTEDQHLTTEQKQEIIEELKRTTRLSGGMLKLISKVTGTPQEEIRGYRIDAKDKPEIHSFNVYRKIRNKFLDYDIDINDWPTELMDEIAPITTLNTEPNEIRQQLKERVQPRYMQLSDEVIELIVEHHHLFVGESNNKWHRFSIKMMSELIPEMLETSKEQSTILTERGFIKQETGILKENGDIDIEAVLDEIYNPVVVKSVREMLKVFNALIKKYPNVDTVVIEMPREKNMDEAKKRKDAAMKTNKKNKETAVQKFMEAAKINEAQYERRARESRKLPTKVRLWWEQEGRCPYSGHVIGAVDLLNNPDNYEIDHIIPQSISFDDRLSNKVLCEAQMNQKKKQQTPYGFMKDHSDGHQSFDEMRAMIKGWKKLDNNKLRNLTFIGDIDDIETRKRFINRNLVDTRYASRVILNTFQEYAKEKKPGMKVAVIRGQFTDLMRRRMNLEKTRDTHHHHAVDASIIAMSPQLKLWTMEKHPLLVPLKSNSEVVDVETGELMPGKEFNKGIALDKKTEFFNDVNHLIPQNRIKFSHQVDKKVNRKVSDATIYSTRQAKTTKDKKEETYVVGKIKNIYDSKDYESFKKVYDKDKMKFIMAQKDSKTFAKLEKIMAEYPDYIEVESNGKIRKQAISPFELYRRDNGYITKYAKKNNGPRIVQVKYYDNKLGNSYINITPDNAHNKQVVLQSLKPWRTDVYFNAETAEYEIMGLKYSDLKFIKGKYGVPKSRYDEIKQNEKVSDTSKFLFSLYRNDRIKVVNDEGESVELLFLSRTKSNRNYVELKPIEQESFEKDEVLSVYKKASSGRCVKALTKPGWKLYKVNVDILGNPHYTKKESQFPENILAD